MIKKASVAGVVAWTAPAIIDSVTAKASAQTFDVSGATCARAQYQWNNMTAQNLIDCANDPDQGGYTPRQDDNGSCKWVVPGGYVPAADRAACNVNVPNGQDIHNSHDENPNRNCCNYYLGVNDQDDFGSNQQGQVLDWWSCLINDSTSCLTITTSKGSACPQDAVFRGDYGDGTPNDWIQISVNPVGACSDCYLQDAKLSMVDNGTCSIVSSGISSSQLYRGLRWEFTSSSEFNPLYLKTWVICNLLVDGDGPLEDGHWPQCVDEDNGGTVTGASDTQGVPCTQCPKFETVFTKVGF